MNQTYLKFFILHNWGGTICSWYVDNSHFSVYSNFKPCNLFNDLQSDSEINFPPWNTSTLNWHIKHKYQGNTSPWKYLVDLKFSHFHRWLYQKLSFWQLWVQPVTKLFDIMTRPLFQCLLFYEEISMTFEGNVKFENDGKIVSEMW